MLGAFNYRGLAVAESMNQSLRGGGWTLGGPGENEAKVW